MRNKGLNYGLDWRRELQEQSSDDWKLGATGLTCMAEIPENERENYLPKGELQFGKEDFMDCATRAPLNILEMKFNYLIDKRKISLLNHAWLLEKGYIKDGKVEFSDRFVAINSETTRDGNSLKAPLDSIRKQGLIPKSMLPAESWMGFDDYHDPLKITQEMKDLGLEFIKKFYINYERGGETDFAVILIKDSVEVGAFAWPVAVNGIYPRSDNPPNHAFMILKGKYEAFDNYLDEDRKDDWIKQLAPNYDFIDTGYRILINKEAVTPQKKTFSQWLKEFLAEYNIFKIYGLG